MARALEVIFFSFEGDGHFLDLIFAFFGRFFVEAEVTFCDLIEGKIVDIEGFGETQDDVVGDGGRGKFGGRADHIDGNDGGGVGRRAICVGLDGDDSFIALVSDVPSERHRDVADFGRTGGLTEVKRGGGRRLCERGSHETHAGECNASEANDREKRI